MITRRDLLRVSALAGGGLLVGFRLGAEEAPGAPFTPNAWLRFEPDGRVVVRVGKSEMGQGVRTALPMIVAEELELPLERLEIEQAWPGCGVDGLGTGGSGSVMRNWDRLRLAGAAARELFVAAAAARWGVAAADCRAEAGRVHERAGGRSFAYAELLADAARLPVPESSTLRPKARADYRLVGSSPARVDGTAIVTGAARYGLDVRLPGLRFAVVARPPVLGGTLVSFDAAAALAVPGVEACFAIPRGVAVVARSTWAALRGRDALRVVWDDGPHADFSSDAHRERLVAATAAPGIVTRRDGGGHDAVAAATSRHEALYVYPYAAHAAIEPVNATAWVRDGRCEIWAPTQTPEAVQRFAAEALGLAPEAVHVETTLLGGGFGRRLGWDMELEAVSVAAKTPHPVQLVWTRDDDLRHGYFQAAAADRLLAGFDADGRLVAWEHRKASTPHNARSRPSAEQLRDPSYLAGSSWGVTDTPYAVPNLQTSYAVVDAPVPIGPWRAVYSPPAVFAREAFVDELAERAGVDPLAWRLARLGADDPAIPRLAEPGGRRLDRGRLRRVLELAAEKAGWTTPPAAGRARGVACNVFHTETYLAYVAEVSRRERPRPGQLPFVVHRVVCALDCGLVIHPDGARQQVESGVVWSLSNMKSAMTFAAGRAREGNFDGFGVLTLGETPAIETHLVASDDERPHGLGEPTVCPLAPAVVNALSRLVGRRIRRLPVTAADLA
ncbi:MAG: molybdopterin-dependent oxidoreductase [Thermoanaerobaculia bacterium]|nr:molybdopterin-dependent oxidoreductase [Thermoanaerobaculia bacterium]